VETAMHGYFYAATDESAVLLGECGRNDCDSEALAFLGYPDAHVFFEQYSDIAACAEYEPVPEAKAGGCPICAVAAGEYHLLGCLVEVCPWCDGQFSRCACRFEQLGIETLDDEELLADLERILEEKGRIPYVIGQGPAYLSAIPDDSDDFEASDE
jgi:hypothetical protein